MHSLSLRPPRPLDRTLHLVKRNVEDNLCSKASDTAKTVDVSLRRAVCYLHKLGYYGSSAAGRKPLLRQTNVRRGKDWAHEMVERSLTFWLTVIFSDESRFSLFSDSGIV